jgi:hypothetical protein
VASQIMTQLRRVSRCRYNLQRCFRARQGHRNGGTEGEIAPPPDRCQRAIPPFIPSFCERMVKCDKMYAFPYFTSTLMSLYRQTICCFALGTRKVFCRPTRSWNLMRIRKGSGINENLITESFAVQSLKNIRVCRRILVNSQNSARL